jgi:hypothetical protein
MIGYLRSPTALPPWEKVPISNEQFELFPLDQGWQNYSTFSLARCTQCCPNFFFTSFDGPASLYCIEYLYIHTYLITQSLCVNYRCYQLTPRENHFYTNQERCEVLTGYLYHWGDGLAVTGHWTERCTVFYTNRK